MSDKEELEQLLVWLPKSLKKTIKEISAREDKPIKQVVTEVLTEFAKGHKEGNDQHMITSFVANDDFLGFPSISIDYKKKIDYLTKHCQQDGRLNNFGKELFGHINQWHKELMKL